MYLLVVLCLVTQSCTTSLSGSCVYGDPPGKNTGVDCHALLQGIFPTQGSNPSLPHCRQILYCLSHQGGPSNISKQRQSNYQEVKGNPTWNYLSIQSYCLWIEEIMSALAVNNFSLSLCDSVLPDLSNTLETLLIAILSSSPFLNVEVVLQCSSFRPFPFSVFSHSLFHSCHY